MAKRKTTELTTITAAALADGDWFPVVDVSDTTDSSTGTNKKIAKSELAEAAGLAAHLADTSDAHDASAISYAGSTNLSATDVESALDELDSEKASVTEPIAAAHIGDGTDAHDASAISVLDTAGNWTATDVEGVLAEVPSRFVLQDRTQTASSETLWSYTTNQAATPLPYSSKAITQTFGTPSVTETNWAIGYGTFGGGGGGAGNISGYLTWLPNCGDTLALQWQFQGVFPGGGAYKGFEFQASNTGNDATRWIYRFTPGSDFAGYFVINDGPSPYFIATTASATAGNGNVQLPQKQLSVGGSSNSGLTATFAPAAGSTTFSINGVGSNSNSALSVTSAGNGLASFALDASTGSGGATLTMSAASTGANSIHFKRAGSSTWSIYDAGSSVLYFRDQTNGVMTMSIVPGSGTSGAITMAASLRVNGNVGFFNTAPAAKPTVTGAKGSNAALGSLMTALAALGLVTDSTSA